MFPTSNDLQFARERNEFVSEPEINQYAWPEAIGFEQTFEDEHAQRVHEMVEEASAIADASRAVAQEVAIPIEYDNEAEREALVDYSRRVTATLRSWRDYELAA